VIAYGYREGRVDVSKNPDGTPLIELHDKPTAASGVIAANFPTGRDRGLLPFPCFEITARFDGGMSGGLVLDEHGAVCGLISTGLSGDHEARPVSYAVALWPLLRTTISADRAKYPRGVIYPAVDLAIDGLIHVVDLADLNPALFPGRALPGRVAV
jgi:hypothetical protein